MSVKSQEGKNSLFKRGKWKKNVQWEEQLSCIIVIYSIILKRKYKKQIENIFFRVGLNTEQSKVLLYRRGVFVNYIWLKQRYWFF